MDDLRRMIVDEKDKKKKEKITLAWKELAQKVDSKDIWMSILTEVAVKDTKEAGPVCNPNLYGLQFKMWSKFVASGKDSIPYKSFLEDYPAIMDLPSSFEPGDEFVLAAALDVKKDSTGKLMVTAEGYITLSYPC